MAIFMKPSETMSLLLTIVASGSASNKYKAFLDELLDKGWKPVIGLFTFGMHKGDAIFEVKLPVFVQSYATQTSANQQIVQEGVQKVIWAATKHEAENSTPQAVPSAASGVDAPKTSPKFINTMKEVEAFDSGSDTKVLSPSQPEQETVVEAVSSPLKVPVPPAGVKSKPLPVDEVIPLSKAKALRQKVKGTSQGSVYHTVALGVINVAVRRTGSSVSVRAEYPLGSSIHHQVSSDLTKMGFTDNGKYLSMHVSVGSIPASRIVGSILLSMGVEFDQMISGWKDL